MKKKLRSLLVVGLAVMIMSTMTACVKPYDKPEFATIEAHQTGFLVSLIASDEETEGQNKQVSFESVDALNAGKVATKEVQIPHRWVQNGRKHWIGEWKPAAKLILVDRKPVTREWASPSSKETANKAIFAESKESVGFYVGMNCSAQIEESDAALFLYKYNNTPLETIIDTDIRSMVEKSFNEECSKYGIEDIKIEKTNIMNAVTDKVTTHFKEYGITITVLGMKEGISFENEEIQKAIDEKFSSEQQIITQQNLNQVAIDKAEADAKAVIVKAESKAEAVRIAADAEAEANKKIAESLTPELIEKIKYEKWTEAWDGAVSVISGGSDGMFIDIGDILNSTAEEE